MNEEQSNTDRGRGAGFGFRPSSLRTGQGISRIPRIRISSP